MGDLRRRWLPWPNYGRSRVRPNGAGRWWPAPVAGIPDARKGSKALTEAGWTTVAAWPRVFSDLRMLGVRAKRLLNTVSRCGAGVSEELSELAGPGEPPSLRLSGMRSLRRAAQLWLLGGLRARHALL